MPSLRRSAPEVSSAASSRPIGTSTSTWMAKYLAVVEKRVPEAGADDRLGEQIDVVGEADEDIARPSPVSKKLMTIEIASGSTAKTR